MVRQVKPESQQSSDQQYDQVSKGKSGLQYYSLGGMTGDIIPRSVPSHVPDRFEDLVENLCDAEGIRIEEEVGVFPGVVQPLELSGKIVLCEILRSSVQ
jgi:hypothetical protein